MADPWLGDSEDSPERFGIQDIAKTVFMPHTAAFSLADRILDRGRGQGKKVVPHTQPPPVAQSAREVQGQFAGLLKTVNAVEEKLDETTRQLAILQRASTGNQDAERFQQALCSALLAALPLAEQRSWFGAFAHLWPVLQNARGAGAALATKPIATFAFPLLAAGTFAFRQPRAPLIYFTAPVEPGTAARVNMFSPDGGEIFYELLEPPAGKGKSITRSSDQYDGDVHIRNAPVGDHLVRARAFVFLKGSEVTEAVWQVVP